MTGVWLANKLVNLWKLPGGVDGDDDDVTSHCAVLLRPEIALFRRSCPVTHRRRRYLLWRPVHIHYTYLSVVLYRNSDLQYIYLCIEAVIVVAA